MLLGLALTAHRKSIIFRREYPQLRELIDRSSEILTGTAAKFNVQQSRWRGIPGDRILELGAVQYDKDKEKFKGRPHDLICFDEVCDFTEQQFRFLMAWARTTIPDQRVRVVAAGNPPTSAEGEWVIRFWAPWLSDSYHPPARPGELRYFAMLDGKDTEVPSGEPFMHEGERIIPLSRSVIFAKLSDNPYLENTNYRATLQGLPEPLRSILLAGLFTQRAVDAPMQVIPLEWIKIAQRRWREREQPDVPVSVVGLDPARGGNDETVFVKKYDNYLTEPKAYPGVVTPDGQTIAGLLIGEVLEGDELSQSVVLNIDVIGIGSSVCDTLSGMAATDEFNFEIVPINFAAGSDETDKSGQLGLVNKRAEAYWKLREMLDPASGVDLALPPGDILAADLAAHRWKVSSRGIQILSKEDVRKKLGRSPGHGDAVALACMNESSGVYFR